MTNDSNVPATVFGGDVAMTDSKALLAGLENTTKDDPRAGSGKQFLNFSGKQGRYFAGAAKDVLTNDVRLAANVSSFMNGWICWKGGKPIDKRFVPASEATPSRPSDSEHGPFERNEDGWMQAKMFMLKDVDTGVEYEFSTNSASGCNAVAGLAAAVRERILADEDCWPLVTLDSEEFSAQGYKNFKPVFTVLKWTSFEALAALLSDDGTDDEDVAPSQVQEEVEAPARRRRSL